MKPILLLFISLCINMMLQAQVSKTIEVTAGNLQYAPEDLSNITNLTLIGTMYETDFRTLSCQMPFLTEIDLTKVDITDNIFFGLGFNCLGGNFVYSNSYLESIKLPLTCKRIRPNAFQNCTALISVEIPSSVKSIGFGSFKGCSILKSVSIPPLVTSIGYEAFKDCSALTSIYVNSLHPIILEENVFDGVDKSKCTLFVPDPDYYREFDQWKDFKNIVEIPFVELSTSSILLRTPNDTIVTMDINSDSIWTVSSDQDWLKVNPSGEKDHQTFTISAEVNPLETCRTALLTFKVDTMICNKLIVNQYGNAKHINITAGKLKSLLSPKELHLLTCLTLSGSIDYSDIRAMSNYMPNLAELDLSGVDIVEESENNWNPANTFIGFGVGITTGPENRLFSVKLPLSVTSIGGGAFYGCSGLTSVTIPSSVISIGQSAFEGCSGLTSVTIPSSVTSIGEWAFRGCSGSFTVDSNNPNYSSNDGALYNKGQTSLIQCPTSKTGSFIIPSSVTSIGQSAFGGCSGLTSVTIPSSVTSIGDRAFYGCSGLTLVSIPSSVTSIGGAAFYRCSGLTLVTIPLSVTSIGGAAFLGCSGLTSVTIPSSVTSIGASAFSGCSGLTSVTIPSSVTSIGDRAFSGCIGLTSVSIPSSVTSIEDWAFSGCSGLTSVSIPSSVIYIGDGAFSGCSGLTLVSIPSSVTSIGGVAFSGCSGLISVTIPSSITSIGASAFSGCSGLTSVTIPSSVTSIGDRAFSGCSGLTTIVSNSINPIDLVLSPTVFAEIDKTKCILKVPYGSKEVYAAADQWKDFVNIVEISFIELSAAEINIAFKQGSQATLDIVSDVNWTVTCDQTWLTINQSTGTGDQTLTFTADGNPTSNTRTAIVTISAEGVESQSITVTQEGGTTALNDLPENSAQFKCYPNPFTDEIILEIQNTKQAEISVDIYNLAGERIKNLANRRIDEKLDLKWNGTNDLSQKVAPGVYLCKVNKQSKQLIYQGNSK